MTIAMMQFSEDEDLPWVATTMAVRVLGQKIKSESETDEEKKKRFLCKGLRDNFVILNFEFPIKVEKVLLKINLLS